MKFTFRKELFLAVAAVCFAFGQSTIIAGNSSYVKLSNIELTPSLQKGQVFFEAEKLYSVNFVNQSPRTASQATHDSDMVTWANKFSNSSERISRNLRGFDFFTAHETLRKMSLNSSKNSYLTFTLIYSYNAFSPPLSQLLLLEYWRNINQIKINN